MSLIFKDILPNVINILIPPIILKILVIGWLLKLAIDEGKVGVDHPFWIPLVILFEMLIYFDFIFFFLMRYMHEK